MRLEAWMRGSAWRILDMQGELVACQVLMQSYVAEAERLGYHRGVSSALYGLAFNHFDLREYGGTGPKIV